MQEKEITSIPLAAYLVKRGFPYSVVPTQNKNQLSFLFRGNGVDEAVDAFFSDLELQSFLNSIRTVRERLHIAKREGQGAAANGQKEKC